MNVQGTRERNMVRMEEENEEPGNREKVEKR
jgi:hypothetical protein